MKNIMVIAITRLGDLIQTEPFLRALKRRNASTHVTLLVERSFVRIANRLVGADRVLALDFNDILGSLDRSRKDLPLAHYLGLANELCGLRFAEVWNLTHNRPAMVLTSLVGGEQMHGVALDRKGLQIVRNDWLTYFFATNLARPWCAFNLVDTYVNSADPDVPFENRIPRLSGVSNAPRKMPQDVSKAHVLLHPGASQTDKQWPLDHFVDVAKRLLNCGAKVTLIGGQKEQHLAMEFPRHPKLQSLIGRTNEEDLIAICSEADLLVSADSGPVHIAAACGTPVIAIEGGSAHGFETAPYNTNAIVIQSHLDNVMRRVPGKDRASADARCISVESVMTAIERLTDSVAAFELPTNVAAYTTGTNLDMNCLALNRIAGGPADYDTSMDTLRGFWHRALSKSNQSAVESACSPLSTALSKCAVSADAIASAIDDFAATELHARTLTQAEGDLSKLMNATPLWRHLDAYLQIARSSVTGENPWLQATELAELYGKFAKAAASARWCEPTEFCSQKELEIEEMK
ncbi:MAG: glycosyltransferase family 9 protein [bacterium]|nr:glycosyltransferase family 9 protein [bacterium]